MNRKLFIILPVTAAVAMGVIALAPSALAAATVQSVELTSPTAITIVYSQPVYTSPADYTDFTGSFAGNAVTSVSGSGSNTVELSLQNSVPSGATGYVVIGDTVQDVSDQQYFGGATWNIMSGVGPALTSYEVSSNDANGSFAGTNDTLTVTFNTNEQVSVANMVIDGHSVSVGGGGTGPYTANYTLESGDSVANIPISFTIESGSNNQTNISLAYNGNGTASTSSGSTPEAAALISQVVPVASIVTTATPNYTFYTNEPGTIVYGGGCSSPSMNASTGSNIITFNALTNGTYTACTIAVVNSSGVQSGALTMSPFTVAVAAGTTATQTTTSTPVTTETAGVTSEIQSLESQLAALEAQASGSTTSKNLDGSAGFNFTNFLSVGAESAQVTALQERLTTDGDFTGPITGYFGSLTQSAVEQYQSVNGIQVKGYVGPNTRAALNAGK